MEREEEVACGEVARALRVLGNFGATVSGLQPDSEENAIGKEQWHAMHERRAAGVSVPALAREFDLDDFKRQLAAWQAEVADLRLHGTTHQRPIDRFADEAAALVSTAGQAGTG